MSALAEFQRESNRIEGIETVRKGEVKALEQFLQNDLIWLTELSDYVAVIQPDAVLRSTTDIPGVRVGRHIAPPSGPALMMRLCVLLDRVRLGKVTAHEAHCEYEMIHPFTDGNGRSGRALWLWMRKGNAPLGFLNQFYYDTLASLPERKPAPLDTDAPSSEPVSG